MVVDARPAFGPKLLIPDDTRKVNFQTEPDKTAPSRLIVPEHRTMVRRIRGSLPNLPGGLNDELSHALALIEAIGEMGFNRIYVEQCRRRGIEERIEAANQLMSLASNLLLKPLHPNQREEIEGKLTKEEQWRLMPRVLAPRNHPDQVVADIELQERGGGALLFSPLYQVYGVLGKSEDNGRMVVCCLTLASANYPTIQP